MQLFQSAVELFGLPQDVRSNAGSENIDIVLFIWYMIEHQGPNKGSFMVGKVYIIKELKGVN